MTTPRGPSRARRRAGESGVPGTPAVSLAGLSKRFPARRSWSEMLGNPLGGGEEEVLQEVDLEIPRGEFFGLLGPNGAGKTTMFRILATLILPDAGTAEVMGRDVEEEDVAVRELVGPVIGNERSLYWRLTARENLHLFGALNGLDRQARRRRSSELLDLVDLAEAGEKIVAEFSSGMKQRLLLARALLPGPEVLLLDEPTRSLDPLGARAFREFLRTEMGERLGCTVLLATHDTEEAAELCDRVGMLHEGRLLEVGTVEELGRLLTGEFYRVWARSLEEERLRWLEGQGVLGDYRIESGEPGEWTRALLEVPGEMEEASRVISSLTLAGADVARFERVSVSLTDVMEQVLARDRRDGESEAKRQPPTPEEPGRPGEADSAAGGAEP